MSQPKNEPLLGKLGTPEQMLSAARARAYKHMPYFRTGVQSLVPRRVDGMGALGVTSSNIMMWDPAVLAQWTGNQAGWVVIHEYMHRFLRHDKRWEQLLKSGVAAAQDRKLWGQAADCEINDNLIEAGADLPQLNGSDPITPSGLGVEPHLTAEQIFHQLKQRQDENDGGGGGGGDQDQEDENDGQGPPGWGREGSGMGNDLPDEPPKDDPDGRSEAEQHVQRKNDAEQIRIASSSKSRGNVPSGLARFADDLLEPPNVRWEDKLASSVRNAVNFVTGCGDFTFTQRARHQGALEMMMGEDAPVLPGEWQPVAEVAVCVDTSGSVDDEQLRIICSEVQGIFKHMGGAKITFISVDCSVHTEMEIKDVSQLKANLAGGGGTDFRPAFDRLQKRKKKPDVVVFATDGYGPAPEEKPDGMHVVWLIIDGVEPCDWGEHIHIQTDRNDEEPEWYGRCA